MSAGPWRRVDGVMERLAGDDVKLVAYPWGEWLALGAGIHGGCCGDSEAAAMEAADLWASEHGYPAVRVEEDR